MTRSHGEPTSDAPARVLALLMTADGGVDPRGLRMLEQLGAFESIGMSRERFATLAHDINGPGRSTGIDRLLDAVTDRRERLVVCRLAAAVLTADGRVSADERRLYERVLSHWHISQTMVTQAIRQQVQR